MKVDDVVPVVGHRWLVAVDLIVRGGAEAQYWPAARQGRQRTDLADGVAMAKGRDLHRDGEARAQPIAEFRFIHDDDELLGTDLHHLLPQQCATPTLHHVQLWVNLIGAIDGHVQV